MSKLSTEGFWANTGARALKTFAQTLVGVLTVAQTGMLHVDWTAAVTAALVAAATSVVTSVSSADEIVPKPAEPPPTLDPEPGA